MVGQGRWSRIAIAAVVLGLLATGLAAAQNPLGRLAGVVLDSSGGVLPGASVTAVNLATNQTQSTTTNDTGGFVFPQLQPGTYRVTVELQGFKTFTANQLVINVGQESSLTARMELGELTETIEVTAGVSLVKTTTPEVNSTVQQKQVLEIPLNGRDVTQLIRLQAGVPGVVNRANTAINGGRPTWTQVTLDGINIQDNFIRTNSLDFLPNRPTSDNVSEFSITTAVSGADTAGGATTVRMATPSGTNTFRGSVFETNRNQRFSANSFFNNKAIPPVPKAELNRNQFGGRLGGPILKNKLFFFGYYEGFRQKSQFSQNNTIPANDDLLQGVFRYVGTDGVVRSANVLSLVGATIDPVIQQQLLGLFPKASNVNNYDTGNSTAARVLNTAGYRFNQTDLNDRNAFTLRLDYEAAQNHRFEAVGAYFRETDDRTDLDFVTLPRPKTYTDSNSKRFVAAWRWLVNSRLQNEVRAGMNLAPVAFKSDWDYSSGTLYATVLSMTNRVGGNGTGTGFMPQGRYTNTYQFNNTGSLVLGSHEIQYGGSWQGNHVKPYNYAGRYPSVTFGFSSAAPAAAQLNTGMLPGISSTDLANANALLAYLSGTISSLSRTFEVKDTKSGYVDGIGNTRNYRLNNIAAYVQDNWRWKPNFTVRAGLKWEYYSPLSEVDNLHFLPVFNGRPMQDVLLDPTATVSFADGGFYNKDLDNFGPNIGFAWDVTKDGRTAIRGGYSLNFVNEETITVGRAASNANAGLQTSATLSNQYTMVGRGVPTIPTPTFLTTRTLADQMAVSATSSIGGVDPNIQAPHVHQVSIGVQRELPWYFAGEARYVGTFGRGIWRGLDYNQIKISDAFLADFNRARSNGFLAQTATGVFNPDYNASIAGSVPLTIIPSFGQLAHSTVRSHIQQGQVAALADFYVTSRVPGALSTFMPNSGIYTTQAILNGGFSNYNSLQFELRRQYRNGFMSQINYTLANTRTDSTGTAQSRFEPYLDNARPQLDTGRALYNVTHVVNANFIYELPFGQGRRWLNQGGLADALFGGWQTSAIVRWQSGSPISILSTYGTFNRAGRSGAMTAVSTLSAAEIKKLLGFYELPDGRLFWIDPKVIDPNTGRGTGADTLSNTPAFAGQVFFNPGPGQVGNLEVLAFDGPPQTLVDLSVSKRFTFAKRYRFEVRAEAFNVLNNPSWFIGDQNINSTTFGRITSVNVGARVIQLTGRFEF